MAFPTVPTAGNGRLLSNVQTGTSNTRTFPSLSGLTKNSGDLLIAICVVYQSSASAGNIFSGWTGSFTEFADLGGSTGNMSIGMAYKFSDGTETGTIAVTQANTIAGEAAMFLLSIEGAHASTPPEVGAIAHGTSAGANIAALDPGGWGTEDTLWIAVGGCGETGTTGSFTGIASAPTNYGDYAETGISADVVGGVEAAVAFRQLNAGSDDPANFAIDTSNARNSGVLVAARPAPSPPVEVPLGTADATSTASLSLTAPTRIPLGTAAATSTATMKVRAPTGVTSRSFDGIGDYLDLAIGSCDVGGPFTIAALFRVGDVSVNPIFGTYNSSDLAQMVIEVTSGSVPSSRVTNIVRNADSGTITAADDWVILAVSKSSGTTEPAFSIYKGGVWTQVGALFDLTVADPGTTTYIRFGRLAATAVYGEVDIAVAAIWDVELSTGDIETLDDTWGTQDWLDLSPVGLWQFNQGSVADDVLDEVGDADETAITGTSVNNWGPFGWDYVVASAPVEIPLGTAAATSSATLALTAQTQIPLGAAAATSTATLSLRAPTQIPLGSAVGTSTASLTLTAPTRIPLGAAAATSTATLTLTATTQIPLGSAAATSTATLDLTTPGAAQIPLGTAAATSTATLALRAQTQIPLGTAAATSTAALALRAPTQIPLGGVAGTSTASLSLRAPTRIPLGTAAATSTAALTLTAPTRIPLGTAAATSTATMALRAQTRIVLGAAAATSTATMTVSAGGVQVPLGTAAATSTATLSLRAATRITLGSAAATSSATVVLKARTYVTLGTSAAISTTFAAIAVPGVIPLGTAAGSSSATLVVQVPASQTVVDVFSVFPVGATVQAFPVAETHFWYAEIPRHPTTDPPVDPVESQPMSSSGAIFTELTPGNNYHFAAKLTKKVEPWTNYNRRYRDRWVAIMMTADETTVV